MDKEDLSASELRKLVLLAFEQAWRTGKAQWRLMSIAVLKNRLLQLTRGEFKESRYGARTMQEVLRPLSDIVRIDGSRVPPIVHLVADTAPQKVRAPTIPEVTTAEQAQLSRSEGDSLGTGELLAQSFATVPDEQLDETISKTIAAWASPAGFTKDVASADELLARISEFADDQLSSSLVNTLARLDISSRRPPAWVLDVVFRVQQTTPITYGLDERKRPSELYAQAAARLKIARTELTSAVDAFRKTSSVAAKGVAIDVIRKAHSLAPYALVTERPLLRELETLLGAAFRKFCESCERHDSADVLRRATTLKELLQRHLVVGNDPRPRSSLWRNVVKPVADHIALIIDEATRRSEASNKPELVLVTSDGKLDLKQPDQQLTVIFRLSNRGSGRAVGIELTHGLETDVIDLCIVNPREPFDLSAGSEQLVTIGLTLTEPIDSLTIPCRWHCATATGTQLTFEDEISVSQQQTQPDWGALMRSPPYTTSPIRQRKDLFGRDALLTDLTIHVSGRNSTFLWGQKRVGKTSVLQVLAAQLRATENTACVVLRMGELISLHEGQIAHRIAERISTDVNIGVEVPPESEFGGGLGRLVPFIERVVARNPELRLVVIIDEFDDLGTSFHTGERGRQFVKALRSLSEIGLTFLFVGSERMDAIYRTHQADLNKWVNVSLDRISSQEDCRSLITKPLSGAIEYEDTAPDFIAGYCVGNPFYIHLFCFEIFKRCAQERRTYVSTSDAQFVRSHMTRVLGPTNFSHFWEDNPELNDRERERQTAENCLVLSALGSLGGSCDSIADILEAQDRMGLVASERLPMPRIRDATERLRLRRVIETTHEGRRYVLSLPIFRDWLTERWDLEVLPRWKLFAKTTHDQIPDAEPIVASELATFPIPDVREHLR